MSRIPYCAFFVLLTAGCQPPKAKAPPPKDPPHVSFAEPTEVVRAAVGFNDICLLMNDGTVRCKQDWRPPGERRFGSFFPVLGINDVVEIAAGRHHACARTRSGGVGCWGRNMDGEVSGDEAIVRGARQIVLPYAAAEVRVADNASCARLVTGAVWCWGAFGGRTHSPPVELSNLGKSVSVAISTDAICSVDTTGHLRCMAGAARFDPLGPAVASQVVVAQHRGCAVLTDGTVRCFGLSSASTQATDVALTDVVQLAAGLSHTCARKKDRTLWCWGVNAYGQLGNGTREDTDQAVQVARVFDAIELYAGGDRTCALRQKGLYCWGADLTGDGIFRGLTGLADDPGPPGPNDSLVPESLRVPIASR